MSEAGRVVRGGAALVLVGAVLAGCGSSTTAPVAAAPTGGAGRGMDPALRQKIDDCLKAAGIAVPTPRPRPTGTPQPRPSGAPRGNGGQFNDPKVQAALKACGITIPMRGQGGGAPPTA